MRRFGTCIAALTLGLAIASPARAYTAIYAFGDSLSDVGNDFLAAGVPAAPYFLGRFSNGPNWLDDLASYYGLAPLLPSLAGGTDYAFGGARSGANAFVPLSGTAALVPTTDQQVFAFATAHPGNAPASALYTVWSGANDLFAIVAAYGANPATPVSLAVTQAADDELAAIQGLAANGATHLLVVGNPDLGATPTLSSTPLASLGTSLTKEYNAIVLAGLSSIPGATYLDVFSLIADAGAYGVTDTTTPCYTGSLNDPNYLTDGTLCSTSRAVQDTHLFWDSFHPTEAGYAIVAQLAVPEPASILLLACGVCAVLVTRRPSTPRRRQADPLSPTAADEARPGTS